MIMMKNYIVLFALYLLNSFFCSTLRAQSVYDTYNFFRENIIKYTGINEESNSHLYNKKSNPACSLKINFFYPEKSFNLSNYEKIQSLFIAGFFGEEYKDLQPKDAVKAYSKNYIRNYKEQLEKSGLYKKERKEAQTRGEDISEISSFYSYEKIIRNTILYNKGNIVSQVVNTYEYTGGAHGSSTTRGIIIDLHAGRRIEFDDVFDGNADQQISDLLLSNLLLARKFSDKDALYEAGFDFDVLHLTDNFIVDDKGVTFIYDQYELGAYALGTVEIFVPYWELVPYMKRTSAIAKLVRIDKMEN